MKLLISRNYHLLFCSFMWLCTCYLAAYTLAPKYLGVISSFMPYKSAGIAVLFILLSFLLPSRLEKPSHFISSFYFIISLTPFFAFISSVIVYPSWTLLIASIPFLFLALAPLNLRLQDLFSLYLDDTIVFRLACGFLFLLTCSILLLTNHSDFNLNLFEVYDYRLILDEKLSIFPFNYLIPTSATVLLPYLILTSYLRQNYIFLALLFLLSVLIFGFTSHKAVLFYPLLVLVSHILLQRSPKTHSLLKLLISAVLISFILDLFLPFLHIHAFLASRLLLVPSWLNLTYIQFFSNSPVILWSNSVLKHIFHYPYDLSPPKLIGAYLSLPEGAHANVSFLGASYMHLGFVGVVFYSAVFSLYSIYLDFLYKIKNFSTSVIIPLTIVPLFIVVLSSDLVTAFLSHGLLLSLIILTVSNNKGVLSLP